MSGLQPPIESISDTALWAAAFRDLETRRPDAQFRDPFAGRLAGPRGEEALREMPTGAKHAWAWTTRTLLFDQFIIRKIAEGADAVVNLAAGLDARPYRMELPQTLRWYEIDLTHLIEYKSEILSGESPRCRLERIPLDLADVEARRVVLQRVHDAHRNMLVVTEGLLIYWSPDDVGALARDLAAMPHYQSWVTELASPGALRMLQNSIGKSLREAGAPLKFGPADGVGFFEPLGWRAVDVRSSLKTGAKLRRLPLWLRLAALLPESKGPPGNRPWSGVCLLERNTTA